MAKPGYLQTQVYLILTMLLPIHLLTLKPFVGGAKPYFKQKLLQKFIYKIEVKLTW